MREDITAKLEKSVVVGVEGCTFPMDNLGKNLPNLRDSIKVVMNGGLADYIAYSKKWD